MKVIIKTLLLALIVCSFSISAAAATFFVSDEADRADLIPGDGICSDLVNACTLRAAISEANATAGADTIVLPAGTYVQTLVAANDDVNAGGDWDISGDLTINSLGGVASLKAAALPGAATERVLDIRSGSVELNQIAIANGRFSGAMTAGTRGAGIENLGTLTLNACTVNFNQISSTGGDAYGGGIYSTGPALTLNDTQVVNNSASRASAGNLRGGGIYSTGGALTLTGSTVEDNSLTGSNAQGGGIYLIDQAAAVITNTSVSGNSSIDGFVSASGAGMFARNVSSFNISGSHFDDNTIGTVTKAIPFNQGVGVGIVVFNIPTTVQISNSTFNRNTVAGSACSGGGLYLLTTGGPLARIDAVIDRSTVDSNEASCTGTGISALGSTGRFDLDITNSTISRNRSTNGSGAGLSFQNGGGGAINTLDVTNTTISNNQSQFNGGGVYLDGFDPSGLTANFNFVTLSGNTVTNAGSSGGGVYLLVGNFNTRNSIFSDNTAATGPDISGTVNAVDFNHIKNTAGITFSGNGAHNTTGFDPQLGALQNNGGPTETRLLAAASPLVNVIPDGFGDCGTTITTDQRGLPRPALSRCDIGATELQSFPGGPFTVSGTITTESGMPIRNIVVVLSEGGLSEPRFVVTGSLGNYQFTGVSPNGYTISISSKRYFFPIDAQFVNVNTDRANINFTGTLQTTRR